MLVSFSAHKHSLSRSKSKSRSAKKRQVGSRLRKRRFDLVDGSPIHKSSVKSGLTQEINLMMLYGDEDRVKNRRINSDPMGALESNNSVDQQSHYGSDDYNYRDFANLAGVHLKSDAACSSLSKEQLNPVDGVVGQLRSSCCRRLSGKLRLEQVNKAKESHSLPSSPFSSPELNILCVDDKHDINKVSVSTSNHQDSGHMPVCCHNHKTPELRRSSVGKTPMAFLRRKLEDSRASDDSVFTDGQSEGSFTNEGLLSRKLTPGLSKSGLHGLIYEM